MINDKNNYINKKSNTFYHKILIVAKDNYHDISKTFYIWIILYYYEKKNSWLFRYIKFVFCTKLWNIKTNQYHVLIY